MKASFDFTHPMTVRKLLLCFLLLFGVCSSQPGSDLQQSHIDGNAPESSQFDVLLKRDLLKFLAELDPSIVDLRYEMLRKGPTQSGVSLPKYYIWVTGLGDKGVTVVEGAARVAGIEKTEFEITNFYSVSKIKNDPEVVKSTFPAALVDDILKRAVLNPK
jgi:hypothetical protein